jgi:hypothetical protein
LDQLQNLEDFEETEANKRQIKDMKYIRIKVKTLRIENEALLHHLIENSFSLSISVPLPDYIQKRVSF